MSEENPQLELEKQLHEQYAINNNANVSSFVSFLTALFVLFGFFGYTFVYTSPQFADNGKFILENNEMTLEIFFIFSIIVVGLLCFLSLISLNLGYSNRRDHFIIYNIRKKYFLKYKYKEIFEEFYDPKGKNFWNFIPDYFNLFYWLFFLGQVFICIFTIIKIAYSNNYTSTINVWTVFALFIHLILMTFSIFFRNHYFKKYNKKNYESIQ